MKPRYAELQVTSYFSFLRGASSCADLFAQASALGIEALAIVDRNSLAGVVQAFKASREVYAELNEKNANWKKVYPDYSRFLADQVQWESVAEGNYAQYLASQKL